MPTTVLDVVRVSRLFINLAGKKNNKHKYQKNKISDAQCATAV